MLSASSRRPRHASVWLLLLCLFLSACGFQFRGQEALPSAVNIQGADEDLSRVLRPLLAQRGVRWASEAPVILRITRPELKRQFWGLERGQDWTSLEQTMHLEALVNGELQAQSELHSWREYWNDSTFYLAHRAEEADLKERILKQQALEIIHFLSRVQP